MSVTAHDVWDWLAGALAGAVIGVVGMFAKVTLDNDKKIAVIESKLQGIDDKLDRIEVSLMNLR